MMPDPIMGLSTQRPEVSVLRTDSPIMAYRPVEEMEESKEMEEELSKTLVMKVGGALGIGRT